MRRILAPALAAFALALTGFAAPASAQPLNARPSARPEVQSPRLYVLNCGSLSNDSPEGFNLTRDEVANTLMADMCFLIVHPKGVLLWDTGIADRYVGRPLGEVQINRNVSIVKVDTLLGQLANIGYAPQDITYLSLSHMHWDHSGNANAFARTATWLVSREERDAMFGAKPYLRGAEDFAELKTARTVLIGDDHDVFGDGSVVIKQAFGHSPGHSVALVNLRNTGPVLLAGDLYHYKEELTLDRMSNAERSTESPRSRARIVAAAKALNAQIWIAHDLDLFLKMRRQPAYYD